jgi:hypothetical protein
LQRFLSLLLLITFWLALWTQPVWAEDQFPKKPLKSVAYVSYPSSDPNSAKERTFQLESTTDYFYTSSGPLYTSEGFRYTWICPKGALLVDNACYIESESGETSILVNPSAAQVAFGYELDQNSTTNEQLIFLASVSEVDSATIELLSQASEVQDDATLGCSPPKRCINPRQCLRSHCADGTKVYPPCACPR